MRTPMTGLFGEGFNNPSVDPRLPNVQASGERNLYHINWRMIDSMTDDIYNMTYVTHDLKTCVPTHGLRSSQDPKGDVRNKTGSGS